MLIQRKNILTYKGVLKDISRTLVSGKAIDGDQIGQFEKEFAKYIGVPHAICVGSGRFALFLIFKALELKEGDEVVSTAFTFKAVPQSILNAGLRPKFVDADKETLNIDPDLIEGVLTSRTKAIIATHLFGNPCDLARITEIAKRHNLPLIEDCAQACGAEYLGKKVGSFGKMSFFSFSIIKVPTTIWGGMIVTDDNLLAEKVRSELAKYCPPSYIAITSEIVKSMFIACILDYKCYRFLFPFFRASEISGLDPLKLHRAQKREFSDVYVRFANIQALIGRGQLRQLDDINNRRRKNAGIFRAHLKKEIVTPKVLDGANPISSNIAIKGYSDILRKKLLMKRIEIDTGYLHNCAELFGDAKGFPVTEEIVDRYFLIDINWSYSASDIIKAAETINGLIS